MAKTITETLGWAALDYWYILVAMVLITIAAIWLQARADRFIARRKRNRFR